MDICGIGGWADVGEFSALSRKFCWLFVLPRPKPWRLYALIRLAGCTGLSRAGTVTFHPLIAKCRSAKSDLDTRWMSFWFTYTVEKNEVMLLIATTVLVVHNKHQTLTLLSLARVKVRVDNACDSLVKISLRKGPPPHNPKALSCR